MAAATDWQEWKERNLEIWRGLILLLMENSFEINIDLS
jgi:hypothetical protein